MSFALRVYRVGNFRTWTSSQKSNRGRVTAFIASTSREPRFFFFFLFSATSRRLASFDKKLRKLIEHPIGKLHVDHDLRFESSHCAPGLGILRQVSKPSSLPGWKVLLARLTSKGLRLQWLRHSRNFTKAVRDRRGKTPAPKELSELIYGENTRGLEVVSPKCHSRM